MTVTVEERKTQVKNQEKFDAGIPKLEGYTRQAEANLLSTRQRLLKRLQNSITEIPFSDGTSEFNIEVRLLSPSEQQKILQLQLGLSRYRVKMLDSKKLDPKDMEKAIKEAKQLLDKLNWWVAEVCVDPELTQEYWSKGEGFSSDVPARILAETLNASQSYAKDLRCFRKK